MNDRQEFEDRELRERLRAALGRPRPPAPVLSRVERLARAGGRPAAPPRPRAMSLGDILAPLAGVALLLSLLFGAGLHLRPLLREPAPLPVTLPASILPAGAFVALLLPLGFLLFIEVVRGGPTLRRWVR